MIINGLFPTPVVKFELGRELTSVETKTLTECERIRNQGNSASVSRYVLKDKKLRPLKAFVDLCLDKYVQSIYAPNERFRLAVTQSWLNYTEKDEFHHKHRHPKSMVSGVFYVNADETTDKIYFFKHEPSSFKVFTDNYNLFNSDSWWFAVKTGDLILFPSHVEHMVEKVQSANTRVSLAFNTFPVGDLGKLMESCKLTISGVE
jgi:uncharacterized protein (TIGR02466 family)